VVRTRVDGLVADGLIDQAGYEAAQRFGRDYEIATGTPASPMARIGDAPTGWRDTVAVRLDAAARVRAIRARIGAGCYDLVVACCVEDVSWGELGRRLGCRDVIASNAKVLAERYGICRTYVYRILWRPRGHS
jgi:hypothetical protein